MNDSQEFRTGFLQGVQAQKEAQQKIDAAIVQLATEYWNKFGKPMALDNQLIFPTADLCQKAAPEAHQFMKGFLRDFDQIIEHLKNS